MPTLVRQVSANDGRLVFSLAHMQGGQGAGGMVDQTADEHAGGSADEALLSSWEMRFGFIAWALTSYVLAHILEWQSRQVSRADQLV